MFLKFIFFTILYTICYDYEINYLLFLILNSKVYCDYSS